MSYILKNLSLLKKSSGFRFVFRYFIFFFYCFSFSFFFLSFLLSLFFFSFFPFLISFSFFSFLFSFLLTFIDFGFCFVSLKAFSQVVALVFFWFDCLFVDRSVTFVYFFFWVTCPSVLGLGFFLCSVVDCLVLFVFSRDSCFSVHSREFRSPKRSHSVLLLF